MKPAYRRPIEPRVCAQLIRTGEVFEIARGHNDTEARCVVGFQIDFGPGWVVWVEGVRRGGSTDGIYVRSYNRTEIAHMYDAPEPMLIGEGGTP